MDAHDTIIRDPAADSEYSQSKILTNARQQAIRRKYEDVFIVDVDAHHYESDSYDEILEFIDESDPPQRDPPSGLGPQRRDVARRHLPEHGRPHRPPDRPRRREAARRASTATSR